MTSNSKQEMNCWGNVTNTEKAINSIRDWVTHKNKDEWLKDMRGNLSLVATVIATMTFQSAINPPGGIRPAEETGDITCSLENNDMNPCPGEAVMSIIKKSTYNSFLYCNTVCFVSSLAVCLLLVSGLPLNNRFFIWLFSIAMCITLTSLTLTYLYGVQMVTPNPGNWNDSIFSRFGLVIFIWMILLGILSIFLCLRLVVWIVTKRQIEKQTEQGEDQNQITQQDPKQSKGEDAT